MKTMKSVGLVLGVSMACYGAVQAQSLKDAIKYTENHQFEESSKILHKLITEKPTDGSLYYYMGDNMWKSERFDSAAIYFDRGIAADPNVGLNYVGKGKVALSKNDEATAKPLFEKALTHHTNDAKAYMAIAEAYVANEWKNMAYAIENLGHAEKLERNNPNVYLLMGDAALLGSNDGLTALNNYEKARDMEPKNPKPYIHIGTLYERARSYDLAIAEYNSAVSLDSNFAPAYYKLGDVYYQFGKYKEAKDYMLKYVKLSKSFSARIKYAKYLFLSKDYEGAIFEIEDLLAIEPNNNILHRLLGYAYYETKNYPEALKNIELFLKNAPTSGDKLITDDYKYYGNIILKNAKDSAEGMPAILQLKTALEMDTMKPDVYNSLADAYLKVKDYDQSIKTIQRKFTIVKEPSTADIFKIGQLYYFKGGAVKDSLSFVKADSAFKIVTEKQSEFLMGHVMRARANAAMDPETKSGIAKPHYETVIAMASGDAVKNKTYLVEGYYYMAYLSYNQGDKAAALTNINKVLELDPANANAPNLKKFIEKLPDPK